jgi:hypothetical protein
MVKRVPADIADIVYSGPVRGCAHKLWNLPEALLRVHKIDAGALGIRLQFCALTLPVPRRVGPRSSDENSAIHQSLLEHLHLGLGGRCRTDHQHFVVSPTAQGVWHVLIISRQQSRFSVGVKSPLRSLTPKKANKGRKLV